MNTLIEPILQPGDVFATENPQMLGRIINFIQKIGSYDNAAEYSHTGVITSASGETIEALWTITTQNLFEAYAGRKVLIARYNNMTEDAWAKGLLLLQGHVGMIYPWWRLPLHIFRPLAKYLSFIGVPVCSELTAKFEHAIGARHRWWTGTNPDMLVGEWRSWRSFDVIAEGTLPEVQIL